MGVVALVESWVRVETMPAPAQELRVILARLVPPRPIRRLREERRLVIHKLVGSLPVQRVGHGEGAEALCFTTQFTNRPLVRIGQKMGFYMTTSHMVMRKILSSRS